jgi:osmoprotectant transport system permease protein
VDLLGDVVSWFGDGANWRGRFGVPARLREHVWASVVSLVLACGVALPIGLLLGHVRRGGALAVNVSNVGRALPSLAVIVLAFQVWGRSWLPVYVALVVLAVPPILTNTYTGIAGVDEDVRESARGMGLTGGQVLRRVELPLGLPLIMAGIRTAAVTVVATATLAALIGLGGLGRVIVDGRAIGRRGDAELLAGALLVGGLSILTEVGLGAVQRALVPKGLRFRDDLPTSLAEGVRPAHVPQPEGSI